LIADAAGHPLGNDLGIRTNRTNQIGGTTLGAGNLISGNNLGGVLGLSQQFQGNYVGMDVLGNPTLGDGGLWVGSSTVGGNVAGAGNWFASGNHLGGGILLGYGGPNSVVDGNHFFNCGIYLNSSGETVRANTFTGAGIELGGHDNLIQSNTFTDVGQGVR